MSSFASTGLSGANALRCCQSGPLRYELELRRLLGEMIREVTEVRTYDDKNSAVVVVPGVKTPQVPFQTELERLLNRPFKTPGGPVSDFERLLQKGSGKAPEIRRIPRGAPLAAGAVLLLAGSALATVAGQTATLETLSGVARLLDRIPRFGDCERCIKRALWSQKRPQKKQRLKIRRRL